MIKNILIIIFTGLLINTSQCYAEYPKTEHDFALLPPYCKAKFTPGSPAESLWARRLDKNIKDGRLGGFGHLHHYCSALHSINIAQQMIPSDEGKKKIQRRFYETATGGIGYMEENADPRFILWPQIYTTKAVALFALDRPSEAVNYLEKAIEKNKKFSKAYSMLADYWSKNGNKKSAIEILDEGLKYSPNSKILIKRRNALSK